MNHGMSWKKLLLQGGKVAAGAALAIAFAGALGLDSGMTAGIITILSIQGTKRDTWRLACERVLAFGCAMLLAAGCFSLLGYTLVGFAVYLLLFTMVCACLGWSHALAMISVLVTHVYAAGALSGGLLLNELALLLIGAGCGMVVNLHLHPRTEEARRLSEEMDSGMVAALRAIASTPEDDAPFVRLEKTLEKAERLAAENRANRLLTRGPDETDYVLLRKSQFRVLTQMRRDMLAVGAKTPQQEAVCALLCQVAEEYHRDNDVSALLARRNELLAEMKRQALPTARPEFESRAVLYGVLLRLEDFLMRKRDYMQAKNEHL